MRMSLCTFCCFFLFGFKLFCTFYWIAFFDYNFFLGCVSAIFFILFLNYFFSFLFSFRAAYFSAFYPVVWLILGHAQHTTMSNSIVGAAYALNFPLARTKRKHYDYDECTCTHKQQTCAMHAWFVCREGGKGEVDEISTQGNGHLLC